MEQLRTQADDDQYAAAFATVRAAKNCLWWLILLTIAVQIAGFVLVRFVGVIDEAPEVKFAGEPEVPGEKPAEPAKPDEAVGTAEIWYRALHWILPAAKFIGLAAATLLVLTLMFAVKLSLLGRTGGVAGFMSAFFWSLLVWVLLIPYQQVLRASFACGALYNLCELVDRTRAVVWNGRDATFIQRMLYYVRFVVYPLFVVLLALAVQAKFARGYRRMTLEVGESSEGEARATEEKV